MQDPRKNAAEIGGQREELQGGRGLGCGTVWRLRSARDLIKSTYCPVHHTHTPNSFMDTRGRSSQE